jgi:hypothetical protein
VKSHLTLYGDVKESDIKRPSLIANKLGMLPNAKEESKEIVEKKFEIGKPIEPRADLMKASG